MTMHAAKGLEFPIIYITGLEEGLFPSAHCIRASEIEEERRLFYVAVTRAMEYCHLSYAQQRFYNGETRRTSRSSFLNNIDQRYLSTFEPTPVGFRPQWSNNTWGDDTDYSASRRSLIEGEPKPVFAKNLRPVKTSMNTGQAVDTDYPAGSRVYHRVFGEGTVQRVYCENDNDKIDILFDTKGQKTLLLTYAKLEKR